MTSHRIAGIAVVSAALSLFTACSGTTTSSSGTVTTSDSATSAPTTPARTTEVPSATHAPPAAFLRSDGLGPFDYGATYDDVLAGMPLVALSEVSYEFPHEDLHFAAFESGRVVCWSDRGDGRLCGFFGGPDATSLTLVGWGYRSQGGVGELKSSSGVTANILVSEVPAIPLPEGDCLENTPVSLDGIRLFLSSASRASAFVAYMEAGDVIAGDEGDC